ncbi:ABC transporter permease subunit [Bosea sp. LjRoot9]|uniref:ABC transporter permease n=1 Tax=Bosea sp. LjRoot9 TaxID=3342341 RepID=UPI003ED08209
MMRRDTTPTRLRAVSVATGRLAYYVMIAFALFCLLCPLGLIFWLSFFKDQIPAVPPSGYSTIWYPTALANAQFTGGFVNSLRVAALASLAGLLVAVPAAIALTRNRLPMSAAILQFLMSPMIVPAIVVGAGLYVGLIQFEILTDLPLVGSTGGLVLGHILLAIPWCLRLILANIGSVDRAVEEAAISLGARPMTVLVKVTVPLMWPGIVAAALFSFVVSFGNLELSLFLVAPGQTTLPIAILQYLEWRIDPSVAAISVLQIVMIAAGLLITDRFVPLTKVV